MPLQDLNDFSRLQIPDVNLVVFATGNDPLPTRDTKTGRNAVFGIRMTCVCFEAARSLIIP